MTNFEILSKAAALLRKSTLITPYCKRRGGGGKGGITCTLRLEGWMVFSAQKVL